VATCEERQECQPGELCVRTGGDSVDAHNVCTPSCDHRTWDEEDGACFPGTFACAAVIRVDGETRLDCLDEFGGTAFVCLP